MFLGPVMIFTGGGRATDDGVKVAATNSMAVMAGVEGRYNRGTYQYPPPQQCIEIGHQLFGKKSSE